MVDTTNTSSKSPPNTSVEAESDEPAKPVLDSKDGSSKLQAETKPNEASDESDVEPAAEDRNTSATASAESEAVNKPELEAADKPQQKPEPPPAVNSDDACQADSQQENATSSGKKNKQGKGKQDEKATAVEQKSVSPEHITELEAEIGKLSIKNTAELFTIRNKLNKLRKLLDDEHPLSSKTEQLQQAIAAMVSENQTHQEDLQKVTAQLIESLSQALEAGQSQEALPTWDRIQGNISNTSGKIRNALQELSEPFKARIDELRDWKIFAATEKKRELITQMEQLSKQDLTPQDLNKRISKLHNDWKKLGRSNDNETLWKEFKTLSDKAYAPCKEFFKQRKAVMADNLKKRRELCDQLEKEFAEIDPDNIHVGNINKLLSNTENEWKSHAPVEQSKIKSLQKRYYGLVNQFRKLRKTSARRNGAAKQALIEEAGKLVDLEDKKQAIETAKELQKKWKAIGPSSFKEDKKYWSEFRAACDKIFDGRSPQAGQRKSQAQAGEGELKKILGELEKLFALEEEEFREAKSHFRTLAQEFNGSLSGKLRQTRSKQVERFNELKRKIDNRFQALPDKKTQALIESLQTLDNTLCEAEDNLATASSEENFLAVAKDFDLSAFSCKDALQDAELGALLDERAKSFACKSSADFKTRCEAAADSLRKLCVETEIRAGSESPAEDQSLRMALQLAQLQDGFGQSRPTNKENIAYSRKANLQQYCLGPIMAEQRNALRKRLQEALGRLL